MNLDTSCPDVPREIFNVALDDADLTYTDRCAELWDEVVAEVMHEEYLKRSHNNIGTYDQGCRGPLCRMALREHPRRKTPSRTMMQLREERIYDPVLEYFHVVIKHRVRAARHVLLKEVT